MDSICSDQNVTRECLAILCDDLHGARSLVNLDNVLASKYIFLVLQMIIENLDCCLSIYKLKRVAVTIFVLALRTYRFQHHGKIGRETWAYRWMSPVAISSKDEIFFPFASRIVVKVAPFLSTRFMASAIPS